MQQAWKRQHNILAGKFEWMRPLRIEAQQKSVNKISTGERGWMGVDWNRVTPCNLLDMD